MKNDKYNLDMELKLVWGTAIIVNLSIVCNRIVSPADRAKGCKIHWLTRWSLLIIPSIVLYHLQIEQRVEKSIGWSGDVHLLSPPMISECRANFSAKKNHVIYRARTETEKTLILIIFFATTGIFGIFSHLKNCPVLLLYDLTMILFALQPVEKQI